MNYPQSMNRRDKLLPSEVSDLRWFHVSKQSQHPFPQPWHLKADVDHTRGVPESLTEECLAATRLLGAATHADGRADLNDPWRVGFSRFDKLVSSVTARMPTCLPEGARAAFARNLAELVRKEWSPKRTPEEAPKAETQPAQQQTAPPLEEQVAAEARDAGDKVGADDAAVIAAAAAATPTAATASSDKLPAAPPARPATAAAAALFSAHAVPAASGGPVLPPAVAQLQDQVAAALMAPEPSVAAVPAPATLAATAAAPRAGVPSALAVAAAQAVVDLGDGKDAAFVAAAQQASDALQAGKAAP